MNQEKKTFNAEVDKILHLMIHSLYTNKEIFMRELISNASDACDKLRYLSQTTPNLLGDDINFKITVNLDKDNKNIIIRDNGIGMNKEDLIENLGTIAKSGTQNFLEQLSGDNKKDNMLIGQFGVGFYSTFMVADYVTVTSRKAGEEKSYTWHSDGLGEYTISDTDREFMRGTEVVVHVKEKEDSYLDPFRLKHILKTYSDHIAIPIYFIDGSNNEIQLNSSSALWIRPKSEVTQEQYQEFYKSVSHSWDEPWVIIHNKNEGAIEFTNLLFIPSTKPYDLFRQDYKKKVKLYIKRVFISDENIDLLPSYLRFLSGVVDSEDLPLNISRETLQHNTVLEKIKSSMTQRVLGELKKKKDESIEDYIKFWDNFGSVLKEGLCEPNSDHQKLLEVSMFRSGLHDKMISLDEYISNCKEDQKSVYYLSGDNVTKLLSSPQIEGFLNKGIDVLLFTDGVDNFWVNTCSKYKDYEIKSATRSNIDLEKINNESTTNNSEESKDDNKSNEYNELLGYFKQVLGNLVKDVKISKKLTSSIACLTVGDSGMDINMERLLMAQNKLPSSLAKVLELNPKHKIIEKINNDLTLGHTNNVNTNDNEQLVKLIFDQACIIEGQPLHDAAEFSKRINDILEKVTLMVPLEKAPKKRAEGKVKKLVK
jgi:molecular chaperone HtpG